MLFITIPTFQCTKWSIRLVQHLNQAKLFVCFPIPGWLLWMKRGAEYSRLHFRDAGWGKNYDWAAFQVQTLTFPSLEVNADGLHFQNRQRAFKGWPSFPLLFGLAWQRWGWQRRIQKYLWGLISPLVCRREVQVGATWNLWWHALYHSFSAGKFQSSWTMMINERKRLKGTKVPSLPP